MRDGRVFLKTLGGLHPVDVILRRLNDDYCDPLELRADSLLGVPGLVQAARDGNVAIANALGSGVVQTPALIPFLPSLCRALLGEELMLPVGRDLVVRAARHPRARAGATCASMVIKPAYPPGPGQSTTRSFGDRAGRAGRRQAGRRRCARRPARYVAQRRVRAVDGAGDRRRRAARRGRWCCATSSSPTASTATRRCRARCRSWRGSADEIDISIARGARSKDTWVISDGAVSEFSLLPPAGAAGRADPRRRRSAEPRGRQLLLARAATPSGPRRSRAWRGSSACGWPTAAGARSRTT